MKYFRIRTLLCNRSNFSYIFCELEVCLDEGIWPTIGQTVLLNKNIKYLLYVYCVTPPSIIVTRAKCKNVDIIAMQITNIETLYTLVTFIDSNSLLKQILSIVRSFPFVFFFLIKTYSDMPLRHLVRHFISHFKVIYLVVVLQIVQYIYVQNSKLNKKVINKMKEEKKSRISCFNYLCNQIRLCYR